MNRYVNKWAYALEGPLAASGSVLPVPFGAMERLNGPVGSVYALTLAPDQDVLNTAPIEIVLATVTAPGSFVITRGAYGTTARDWDGGAVIYAVLLAEQLNSFEARFAEMEARLQALEGGGVGENTLTTEGGEALTDPNNEPLTTGA